MSARKAISIHCDGPDCLTVIYSRQSLVNEVRAQARQQGWATALPSGTPNLTLDLCPNCRKATR